MQRTNKNKYTKSDHLFVCCGAKETSEEIRQAKKKKYTQRKRRVNFSWSVSEFGLFVHHIPYITDGNFQVKYRVFYFCFCIEQSTFRMKFSMWFDSFGSMGSDRKGDPRISGCISNWGAHGLLKRGLRRWGSTGSWVCCAKIKMSLNYRKYNKRRNRACAQQRQALGPIYIHNKCNTNKRWMFRAENESAEWVRSRSRSRINLHWQTHPYVCVYEWVNVWLCRRCYKR